MSNSFPVSRPISAGSRSPPSRIMRPPPPPRTRPPQILSHSAISDRSTPRGVINPNSIDDLGGVSTSAQTWDAQPVYDHSPVATIPGQNSTTSAERGTSGAPLTPPLRCSECPPHPADIVGVLPVELPVVEIVVDHRIARVRQWVRDPVGPIRPQKSLHPPPVPDTLQRHSDGTRSLAWLAPVMQTPPRSATPTSLSQPHNPEGTGTREFASSWIIGDGLGKNSRGTPHAPSNSYTSPPRPGQLVADSHSVRKAMEVASLKFGTPLLASPVLLSPLRKQANQSTTLLAGTSRSHSSSCDELLDDGIVTPAMMPVHYAPNTFSPSLQNGALKMYDHRMLPRESLQWSTPQPVHVAFGQTP